MKRHTTYPFLTVALLFLVVACGPSQEELQRQQEAEQQARLDSLERVWEEEMAQMRQDSLAQAEQERLAQAAEEAAAEREQQARQAERQVTWQSDGPFTVQVRSWRSEERANEHARVWRDRGFSHAYVVKHGDETVGDVWFRVRLGNVGSYSMAQRLQENVLRDHNTRSWIASASDS